ncbi:glycerol-3-phosphate dehydrogenase, partial [Agrobacterium sp. NPDC090273]
GGTLYEIEVRWLVEREWAVTADDILWRRTKQGLRLSGDEVRALQDYLDGVAGGHVKAI